MKLSIRASTSFLYLKSWKITSNVPIITLPIKTLLNLVNSATYDFCLAMTKTYVLEQRRILQSLILFFNCFKLDGPNYISQFFTPRLTKYNLRDNGLNVVQPPYNSLVMHNSYLYMIAHIWNQLPTVTKSSSTLAQFRALLNNVNFWQSASVWTVLTLSIFTFLHTLGLVYIIRLKRLVRFKLFLMHVPRFFLVFFFQKIVS